MPRPPRATRRSPRPPRPPQRGARGARSAPGDPRERFVDAAFRAVVRHGPAVSMDRIAAEAGVTKPILYRHFGDKTGLVAAVTRRYLAELGAELSAVDPALPLRDRARRQFELGLAYLEERPGLLPFIDRELGFEATESREGEHVEGLLQIVRGLLAARGGDPRTAGPWAHGIAGLIMGSVLAWLRERERAPASALPREAMAEAATALLFEGVGQLLRA